MSSTAIEVRGLSKCYRVWNSPSARLHYAVLSGMPLLPRAIRHRRESLYKDFYALKNVDLLVRRGESVGIVGRNGSGKSTLLQLIAGTLAPTKGETKVNGRLTSLLELGAGFNPDFSGRENVLLSCAILGLSDEEALSKVPEIEQFAQLGEYFDQPVKAYSSGMLVRLAFSTNAFLDPDILIVDEALAVGDLFFQVRCHERMERLRDSGTSILFVSHDLLSVQKYCNRAVLLEKGSVVSEGRTSDICNEYVRIGRTFGGFAASSGALGSQQYTPPVLRGLRDSNMVRRVGIDFPGVLRQHHFSPGIVEFLYFAVLDEDQRPTSTFIVGQRMKAVLSLTALHQLTVPVFTYRLTNKQNINVHSKHTIQHRNELERPARVSDRLSVEFDINLSVSPGEYILYVGLVVIPPELESLDVPAFEVAYEASRKLVFDVEVGPLVIMPDGQKRFSGFWGAANLHSTSKVVIEQGALNE